ncbi:A24 family peptidase [Paenisporosarcina cavernae]|uniref:Prepilin peptidase n=1 Tax=Paenisporosarcina cavernae TaxID=2320858 RepID=A0A385YRL1_9BACL|nr:A24 family peptidase [Paenisporosarcina cavernae]AYC28637.1 prepilin peptidase [Paenisporosarcina cavernae]
MPLEFILMTVLVISFVTDVKSRKIYNTVLLPAFFIAVIGNTWQEGFQGLTTSLLGFVVGFAILFIPYVMKGMGAGDVKLMAVIGAFMGPTFIVTTAIFMAIVGAVIATILITLRLIRSGQTKLLLGHTSLMTYRMKLSLFRTHSKNNAFPYGVAIVAGAFITFFTHGVIRL